MIIRISLAHILEAPLPASPGACRDTCHEQGENANISRKGGIVVRKAGSCLARDRRMETSWPSITVDLACFAVALARNGKAFYPFLP
jgi:hypothetical protein